MRVLACLVLAIVASACSPFWGDDTCSAALEASDDAPPPQVDPETLECHEYGSYCNPSCGECPEPEPANASWAHCGECAGIDETSCLLASACRAVYDHACFTGQGGPCALPDPYVGCYGVARTGPIQGSCLGLDALGCSRHDDCFALHTRQCDATECWWQFIECRDEDSCWGPVDCDVVPPDCPPGSTPQIRDGCYTGDCTPLDECEPMPPPV